MDRTKLHVSTLRPTNSRLLDLDRVQRFLDMLRLGREIGPIITVGDEYGKQYIICGHSESYASLLANAEIDANVLTTDSNVQSCTLGRTRKFSTLKDLLEDCERGNAEVMAGLGIEMVADYAVVQPMHAHQVVQY